MLNPTPPPPRPAPGRSASELLDDLADAFPGEKTSVGALIDLEQRRSLGKLELERAALTQQLSALGLHLR